MMDKWLLKLDKRSLAIVTLVGQLAEDLGFKAYLVGGPVRDLMLGHKNIDLDITTEGSGIRLAEAFAKVNKTVKIIPYQAFKTATVELNQGQMVDFATARKESYVRGGAFPQVEPSNLRNDLFRRDFTINAMAISICPSSFGKIFDPFKGRDDLKYKRVRVLHANSFIDDPTRILRAARFKTRLGFKVERQTLGQLNEAIRTGALNTIKPQRYKKEFDKILKEKRSKEAIKCLKQWEAYRAPQS